MAGNRVDHATRITMLGTCNAIPDVGDDTVHFLINDRYLVDTGWQCVTNLRSQGIDPLAVEYVILTHLHHDHYLSLHTLLYYRLMEKRDLAGLRIIGPAADVAQVVEQSLAFLQTDRFYPDRGAPTVIPLAPGEGYDDPAFSLATCATVHPVAGLCYRFTDHATGVTVSFTGDTAYHPPISDHVRGSDLLITEATLGPLAADAAKNPGLHSSAEDAARIAAAADVSALLLVHANHDQAAACVQAARAIFPLTLDWPVAGQVIELAGKRSNT